MISVKSIAVGGFFALFLFSSVNASNNNGQSGESSPAILQKTLNLYDELMVAPLMPSKTAINSLVAYEKEDIDQSSPVMFDFRAGSVVFTFACEHVELNVKGLKYHLNKDEQSNIGSALELRLEKNSDLRGGQRKIFIYYDQAGNVDHIRFGKADYYFD